MKTPPARLTSVSVDSAARRAEREQDDERVLEQVVVERAEELRPEERREASRPQERELAHDVRRRMAILPPPT